MANDPALPGFVDADQFVGSLHPVTSDAALAGPDVAVRARLNAIVLDGVVLALSAVLVSSLVGVAARSTNGLLLAGGLQFLYFFCFEAATGQTIGKRVFHIHVAALNGAPPTLRQVAMRNVLRLADALPLLYASGLISMMRTGRRRQRIGDVAAGTVVVGDTGGFALRTPRWLLPLTTLLATGLSVVLIVAILDPRASSPTVSSPTTSSPIVNAPVTSAPVPIAAAFANATRQPPLLGIGRRQPP